MPEAPSTKLSFEDFARTHRVRLRGDCPVCVLPPEVHKQIALARERGAGYIIVGRYLAELGYEIARHTVRSHLEGNCR